MPAPRRYWFLARRHGWGWGAPATWQGWTVIAVFGVLAVLGLVLFPPDRQLPALILYLAALNAGLMGVCWRTGAPPTGRRGDRPPR